MITYSQKQTIVKQIKKEPFLEKLQNLKNIYIYTDEGDILSVYFCAPRARHASKLSTVGPDQTLVELRVQPEQAQILTGFRLQSEWNPSLAGLWPDFDQIAADNIVAEF